MLKKINVLMYMCSRRFYNVLPEVSGCPNLGSSYKDKKKIILYFWINGLETTEEECFSQQLKVFVSVYSIHHICINSLVPSVKKINIGNPGIQVNYWGG